MTNIHIKYQFCKEFTDLCGSARSILWELQQNLSGIVRLNAAICTGKRERIASHIKKLRHLTIETLEKEEGTKIVKKVSKKVFSHIFYGNPLKGLKDTFTHSDMSAFLQKKGVDNTDSLLRYLLEEGYLVETDAGMFRKEKKLTSLHGKVIYCFSDYAAKLLKTKHYFEINLKDYTKLRSQGGNFYMSSFVSFALQELLANMAKPSRSCWESAKNIAMPKFSRIALYCLL